MLTRLLNNKKLLFIFALLVLIILYPPRSLFKLHTDDFLIRAYVTGEHPQFLHEESKANKLANAYYFFGSDRNKTEKLKEYGALPWWSDDSASMSMFRPISALTHYIDYAFLNGNFFLIQLHSFFWLCFLFFSLVSFYKKFNFMPWILVLASAMFIIDLSHMTNFYWLAARNVFISTAFGLLAVRFHMQWRERQNYVNFFSAILFFCLSLLSAEAGIAAGAYLLAYALFLDEKKPIRGLLSIVPYGILLIIWRVAYQVFQYGSQNISLYVDPVNSLQEFLLLFFQAALLIITAVISGMGSMLSGMSKEVEGWYLVFGACLLIFSTILIMPLLRHKTKESAQLRFFYAGFLFSVIPFCALSTYTTRSGVFAYVGFSVLLAALINQYWQDKNFKIIKRLFIAFALICHLLIPAVLSIFVSLNPNDNNNLIKTEADLEHALPSSRDKYTVYLNYPSEVNAMFLPYTWQAEGYDEPLGLIRWAPGLNTYTLTRVSERGFILTSDYHFVLNQHGVLKSKYENIPSSSLSYGLIEAMGFTANNARKFTVSEKIVLKNYTVEILEVKDSLPSKLKINFSEHIAMNQLEWRLWRWDEFKFEAIAPIAISESLEVLNQWDDLLKKDETL